MNARFRLPGLLVLVAADLLCLCGPAGGSDLPQAVAQNGHSDGIPSIALSADGKMFVSGGFDKTAVLWQTRTAEMARAFSGHDWSIMDVALSDDGNLLVTGSSDYTARLWSTRTGEQTARFADHQHWVVAVAIASRSQLVLTGSFDKTAKLWNAVDGSLLCTFSDHTDYVRAVAFSRDESLVASAGDDRKVFVYDTQSRRRLAVFDGAATIEEVSFSPSGTELLVADAGGRLTIWDWRLGSSRQVAQLPGDMLYAAFSGDGRRILASSSTLRAVVLDAATGRGERRTAAPEEISAATISPDGTLVVTGDGEGHTEVWDLAADRRIAASHAPDSGIAQISVSADARYILAGAARRPAAHLWDTRLGGESQRWSLSDESEGPTLVSLTRDGRWAVLAAGDTLEVRDVVSGATIHREQRPRGVTAVAACGSEPLIATGDTDGRVFLWGPRSQPALLELGSHRSVVEALGFAPDCSRVASGSNDLTSAVWDVRSRTRIREVSTYPKGVGAVAFSPDGLLLATGSDDNEVRLWDVASGAQLHRLSGHSGRIDSLDWSADGRLLLSGSWDGTLILWSTGDGKLVRRVLGHGGWAVTSLFAENDTLVVSGGADGAIRLWRHADGQELQGLATLHSLDRGATIVGSAGQFDSTDLHRIDALRWVFEDDPYRPLAPEIFLRDFYEPRLLPRLLEGKGFSPPRPLESLNRVQPRVEIEQVTWTDRAARRALVTAKVARVSDRFPRAGRETTVSTDVYDLRLFRDGQLVGWAPGTSFDWQRSRRTERPETLAGLQRWRDSTRIALGADGTASLRFPVQVDRRAEVEDVTFTAYAFNEDRVKSATATRTEPVPGSLAPRRGKAYVITVGVNKTDSSPAWDLQYAVNDARALEHALSQRLQGQFAAVVPVRLVSDRGAARSGEAAATRAHLRTVLDRLAGRPVDAARLAAVPAAAQLQKAEPEDFVLLGISSHGYTDDRGIFHFVLADIGRNQPQRVTPALQQRTLSSDELSEWLREVDAGELVLIVDACHSEATVSSDGFKPGPMGSRGLGQLAYDKGMRVLAASRAQEVAIERGGPVRQGLLTYALVQEGLEKEQADFQPQDGAIGLAEWLAYAVEAVPRLFADGDTRGSVAIKGATDGTRDGFLGRWRTAPRYQQPVLFDFVQGERPTPDLAR